MAASATAWRQLQPAEAAALAVDGLAPRYLCQPESYEAAAQAVEQAAAGELAIVPRGAGSGMGLGFPPSSADLVLSTLGLDQVVAYEPADLTVTAQAGLSLGALQALLRSEGQFLPLDPPGPLAATLGGIIAANASGPLRFAYGTARDLVLGTRVVGADGQLSRAGGRVVKNVAGYDLNKLYIGSLGTLGIVVELSFKLLPLPEVRGTVAAVFPDPDHAGQVLGRAMRSALGPHCLSTLGSSAARAVHLEALEGEVVVLLRAAGVQRAVARQIEDLGRLCVDQGGRLLNPVADETQLWDRVRDLAYAEEEGTTLARLSVPPGHSISTLAVLATQAAGYGLEPLVFSHAGNGIVYVRLDRAQEDHLDAQLEYLSAARRQATVVGGGMVLEAAPRALKDRFDVWGEVGPSLRVMQVLKRQLDPGGILNPGRFVGRI